MKATSQIEKREILVVFRQLADSNKAVRLLNVYKGVPISYEAKIIQVADKSALFRTEKIQLVCLAYEGFTHIQSLYLPKIVFAHVQDIDVDRSESVIGDFEYASGKIGARTQVRVMPDKSLKGYIQLLDSDIACEGELRDISLDGLGFSTARGTPLPEGFKKGSKIGIQLSLPGRKVKKPKTVDTEEPGGQPVRHHTIRLAEDDLPCVEQVDWLSEEKSRPVTLHGEIMNIYEETVQQCWRIGVRIDPRDPHMAEISHYITHRQAEIMREIRQASLKMSHGKGLS